MAQLSFIIFTETDVDYNGISETIKNICAYIDGVILPVQYSEESVSTDMTCKTNFKTYLTDLGYTWDTEV